MGAPIGVDWDSGWAVLPPLGGESLHYTLGRRAAQIDAACRLARPSGVTCPYEAGWHWHAAASIIARLITPAAPLPGRRVADVAGWPTQVAWVWGDPPMPTAWVALRVAIGREAATVAPWEGVCGEASWEWSSYLTRSALARDPWRPLLWHPTDPAAPSPLVARLSAAVAVAGHHHDPAAWWALADAYLECGMEAESQAARAVDLRYVPTPPCRWGDTHRTAWGILP